MTSLLRGQRRRLTRRAQGRVGQQAVETLEDRALLTTLQAGFDLFETAGDGSTFVDLSSINPGLSSNVTLEGVPLDPSGSLGLGNTDTIVHRKQGIPPLDPGRSAMVDIELVALSLRSVDPVDISSLGGSFADLYITIDPGDAFPDVPQPDTLPPSIGQMEIIPTSPLGGTFNSCFGELGEVGHAACATLGVSGGGVFADGIFVVPGGDPNNPADVLFSAAAPPIALSSIDSTWLHWPTPGYPLPPGYPAGDFYPVELPHVGPHNVEPAKVELTSGGALIDPVTKSDVLVTDVDGDHEADPGDTLRYYVNIFNSGDADATNVSLQDLEHPGLAFIAPTLNVSPVTVDDGYLAIGNIAFDSAALGMPGVLDNDREFLGDELGVDTIVTDFDATSAQGGTVAVDPSGSFTYDPPIGFTGTDTFSYTATDPGGLFSNGFVSIDVAQRVWFIDSVNGSDVNPGTFADPFQTPGATNAVSAPGDWIYVLDDLGTGTNGGFLLKDDQTLLGQGVPLEFGNSTYVPPANRPVIGSFGANGINVAANNTIRGLDVNSPHAGIVGLNVGAINIDQVHVTANSGSGVDLRNGSGVDITFDGLVVSNISNAGLSAVRFENLGGNVNVSGDTMITDIEGPGFVALGSDTLDIDHGGQLVVSNIGASGLDSVSIDLNVNSTIDIDGGVDITTTNGGDGLVISSSGTINIFGTGSSINALGIALNVSNTQIGAGGLTFQTIQSGFGFPGTLMTNTGMLGGLTILNGGLLNDIYNGSDGDDFLHGGPGEDELNGGSGFDTAVFTGPQSDYVVADLGGGDWEVEHIATGHVDTLTSIEQLQFDDGTVPGFVPPPDVASPAAPSSAALSATAASSAPLVVGPGDVIAPGDSPGTTPAGDTVFDPLGTLVLEVSDFSGTTGADPGWDLLDITGTLTINATPLNGFVVDLVSLLPGLDTSGEADNFDDMGFFSIDFVRTTGGITGFDPSAFVVDTTGFLNPFTGTFTVRSDGDNLWLDYTPANSLFLHFGTLPPGKGLTVSYDATINGGPGLRPTVGNQGMVHAAGPIVRPTDDPDTVDADDITLTAVDTLTLGNQVWIELTGNTTYERKLDFAVRGVTVNLFADDGATAGSLDATDTFLTSTTTSVLGRYEFTGLLPGDYIVEIPSSEFDFGGPLFGTTTLPDPATDPDDDIDHDDNGEDVAGFGVAAQAVTLTDGAEPTDDGDGDADTNLTVDFGFLPPVERREDPSDPGRNILHVTGTPGPDSIQVISVAGGTQIRVWVNRRLFPAVDVATLNRIDVDSLAGGDVIYFQPTINLPTIINAGAGNNLVIGGAGPDTINGGMDTDTIFAGAGNDTVNAGPGNDRAFGGPGMDELNGNDGVDTLRGGAGDDMINGGGQGDYLDGGPDVDTINGGGGPDRLFGGPDGDTLNGDGGDDMLFGQGGIDELNGGPNNDRLFGGDDGDTLNGGMGLDSLRGQAGNDTLNGGDDNDYLDGGDNNDTLNGGPGRDVLLGRGGDDSLFGDEGDDILAGEGGDDLASGGTGTDVLFGGADNDILLGGPDDDVLFASGGRDLLIGGIDSDALDGGGDDDILIGSTTTYDANTAQLQAILNDWVAAGTAATRINNIQNGGTPLFPGTNVFDDAARDMLEGSAGTDWVFQAIDDALLDTPEFLDLL